MANYNNNNNGYNNSYPNNQNSYHNNGYNNGYNNNYQQPNPYHNQGQQPYNNPYQQQPNMHQGHQLGQQLKNNRRGPNKNKKLLFIILGIILLLGGGVIYYFFFYGTDFEDLSLAEQSIVAYEAKIEEVLESENQGRLDYLDTYSTLYFLISSNDAEKPGVAAEVNRLNTDIAIAIETIKHLEDGKEKEQQMEDFSLVIKNGKVEIQAYKEIVTDMIDYVFPTLYPITENETAAKDSLLQGYKDYLMFLNLYEKYLENPSADILNKALEQEQKANRTLYLAFMEYLSKP